MALQAEIAVRQRTVTLLLQQGNGQKFALAFAHLTAVGVQVVYMEPVVTPLVTEICFTLGDLIGVVREGIINAAAVDIQVLAQVLHRNAAALDVPAGVTHTPGGIPLQLLVLKLALGEPQHKVRLVALVLVLFHALPDTDGEILLVVVVKDIILLQLGGIKVNIAACYIGVALFQQPLHQLDEFGNAGGGGLHHIRDLNIQLAAVLKEGVGVVFGDLHHRFMLALRALQHLVLAGIGVAGEMSHIGDVHDPLYIVAAVPQVFFQHILHDVGAQIADMGKVVHGGAAGIHLHDVRVVGHKFLFFVAQTVIKLHSITPCITNRPLPVAVKLFVLQHIVGAAQHRRRHHYAHQHHKDGVGPARFRE